jgi:hypothetical protein
VVRLLARLVALGLALSLGGCGPTLELRPEARALAPAVTVVVSMPTSVDFGGPIDQRRLQRRVGDRLLELTGGRAVVAEELAAGDDDASVQKALVAVGEDPGWAVTFALHLSDGRRLINNARPIASFTATRRLVVDFTARVEVRRLGAPEVIGTVEAISTGPTGEPEIDAEGQRRGPLEAIDDALAEAVRAFAPRLLTPVRSTLLVEVPVAASASVVKRVAALAELYPELGEADLQRLATSRERFLVVEPGALLPLGLARGDLVGVPGRTTTASRAALMRAVARGRKPLVAVERGGQHYILAATP